MKQFYTLSELASANLPDLPRTEKSLDNLARAKWRNNSELARLVPGKTKSKWEYHISLLPRSAQTRLLIIQSAPANDDVDFQAQRKRQLWAKFEGLSSEHIATCEQRLAVLKEVSELAFSGMTPGHAVSFVAGKTGVKKSAYYEWRQMVEGLDRTDWLAALAPSYRAERGRSDCAPEAWEFLTSDFLRAGEPAFSACYRRMLKAAKKEGWTPIASERSLRRRMDAVVPAPVQTLAREGKDKAKTLYPAQRRSRQHLHAMQMVNMDGHKIDVFVRVPWSEKPVRMFLIGIQDLFSGKVLAWRLSDSENKETVRLVIGDMVELWGIPEDIYLDNGRSFASKWISGGSATRFRFKVKEEEPDGVLTALKITPHWTTPYSGQSKPIERAWRDLAENISKHPFCDGAYTGNKTDAKPENYMNRAIPLEEFRMHVAEQVADHNSQAGRTAATCKGRSFNETFETSIRDPATIVRWPVAAQRSLWLLASELITAKKGSGEIHYQGNRYWSRALNEHAGRKITIRFDPDHLHAPVKVYDLKNSFICDADCIADVGFDDVEKARSHARSRRDYMKSVAAQAAAEKALSAQQLADILYKGNVPAKAEPIRPSVTRLVTSGNHALAHQVEEAIGEDEFSDNFARALGRVSGGASIIEFPQGNGPGSIASGLSVEPKSTAYGSKKKGGKNPAR
jgi:putative transposase